MNKSLKLLSSYNSILLIVAQTFTNPFQKKEAFYDIRSYQLTARCLQMRPVFCRRVEKPSNNESLTARNTQGPDNSEM